MEIVLAMLGLAALIVLGLIVVMPLWELAEGKQKIKLRELEVRALEAEARLVEARDERAPV